MPSYDLNISLVVYSTKSPKPEPQETLEWASCGDFSFLVNQCVVPYSLNMRIDFLNLFNFSATCIAIIHSECWSDSIADLGLWIVEFY